jgi:hypothetical protein
VTYTSDDYKPTGVDIYAKLYNSSGKLVQSISVAAGLGAEENSSVAMTPGGAFDVAYQRIITSSHDIALRHFSSSGTFLWTREIANTAQDEIEPSVSVDNRGNAVVVYRVSGKGEDVIHARRVSSAGRAGLSMTIASYSVAMAPVVSVSRAGGHFVVAFVRAPS